VKSWNIATGDVVQSYIYARPNSDTITNNLAVTSIAYSLDGEFLAVGYKNGAINYFRSDQDNPTMQVENYPSVEDLIISPDKRFIYASNGSNAEIDIWNIQTAKKEKAPLINPTPISTMSMSPDQQYLLAGGSGNSVYLWDLFELKQVSSFPNLGSMVTDLDVSFDSKYVAIGLKTGEIKVFAIPAPSDYSKTHVPMQSIKSYQFSVLGLSFAPDQLTIASGNIEEGLKFWDAQSGENVFSLDQSMRGINEIFFSSDGSWLASAHEDNVVRIWNVNEAKETYKFEGYLPKGTPFSPDNRFLAYI
jgi:WD40 repeat protein